MDFHMTDTGDIAVSPAGDIAVTNSQWRDYTQQAYLAIMTPMGDFSLYPLLGTELENLIGMPQTVSTGEYGKELITRALSRLKLLTGVPINITATPVSLQAIRFDIYLTAGSRTEMLLSIEQNLGLEDQ